MKIWLVMVGLASAFGAQGQGWMKFFEDIGPNSAPNSKPLISSDGKYLILGVEDHDSPVADSAIMLKVDVNGDLIWKKNLLLDDNWKPTGAIKAPDGNIVLFGSAKLEPESNIQYFAKMDENCNLIWQDSIIKRGISRAIVVAPEGGFVIAGGTLLDFLQGFKYLFKIDDFGNLEWINNYQPFAQYTTFNDIKNSLDGNYIALEDFSSIVHKLDSVGNIIWSQDAGQGATRLEVLSDGSVLAFGSVYITKIDADGTLLWQQYTFDLQLPIENWGFSFADFTTNEEGELFALGKGNGTSSSKILDVTKYDSEGELIWRKEYGNTTDEGATISIDTSGNLILTAIRRKSPLNERGLIIIKTDSLGVLYSSALRGTVHQDIEGDCLPDTTELGLAGWLVQSEGTLPYFTLTDSSGQFFMPVDTGTYTLSVVPPGPYWGGCNNPTTISVTAFYDTLALSFPAHPVVDCPYMTLDISAPRLRRCFDNNYYVHYCNDGTATAEDVTLEVTLDPFLTYISAGLPPASQNGNTLTFNLGEVAAGDCGSFYITTYLGCDETVLGQTHCTSAHITPDSLCLPPDPIWDGSSIEVDATCNGDSIIFTITNVGSEGMPAPLSFIIIEDQIVLLTDEFQLGPGQSTTITLPANGSTIHLEAQQAEGHPSGQPSTGATIEGCGGWMSLGLFTQWAFDDDPAPFTDVDCQANIGSYDPNDKQGFPAGLGEEHLIEPGQDLEYLIRFQNTGTDTAFKVTIVDVLPPELDLASIRPGASSHPYTYGVTPEGWPAFTFDGIMLPDSNVNEPASHGFVRFRASQRPGLGWGNVIANTALIYFDFNEPVQTNTYKHRIGQLNPWTLVGTEPPVFQPKTRVKVMPNPLTDSALLQVEGIELGPLNLVLTDVSGKILRQQTTQGTGFEFQRGELAPGVYFFQINRNDERVGSGKLMVR